MKRWGRDLSVYQSKGKFAEFKAEGESFVIIRLGYGLVEDALAKTHIEGAQDAGTPTMFYHYLDPAVNATRQADKICELATKRGVEVGFGDIESRVKSMDLYLQALAGKIPWSAVPNFTADELNTIYQNIMTRVGVKWRKWGGYSGDWFVRGYAPKIALWIGEKPHWMAYYPDRGTKAYRVSYAGLRAAVEALPDHPPAKYITMGVKSPVLWQFTSRMIFPGDYAPTDVNVFTGTEDDWQWMTGEQVHAPPPVTTSYKSAVVAACSWATAYPDDTSRVPCDWYKAGTAVTVYETSGNRARVGVGRWINTALLQYK